MIPTILPSSCCWLRKRPSISATTFAGRPKSWSACSKASAACCAWQRSRARRSCAVRRRCCLVLACFLADRLVLDMVRSCVPGGSVAVTVWPSAYDTSLLASVRTASLRRRALLGLPAFFCQPCAVYICPNGFANSHTVYCAPHREREGAMIFEEILDQALAMVQRRGRVTYRTLKLQFALDDEQLATLKDELLYSQPHVVDDAGRGLLWTGDRERPADSPPSEPSETPVSPQGQMTLGALQPAEWTASDAERRQLTVLFCDLVDSTRLSTQLDPEDYRDVVRAYQSACAEVIQRYDGYIAQYLGDGLLVYFGYPLAHEDDAQRAVRAGLGMLAAMGDLHQGLQQAKGIQLAIRLGMHTGVVVVGAMGGGGRQEQLALGDVPNIAARLQGLAEPNTIIISADTHRLIQGYFRCQDSGAQTLRGVTEPVTFYRV